jgi:hypothetical protein
MGSESGGKRNQRVLALLLAFAAAVAFTSTFGHAQKALKKMSKQDVIDLLTGDVSSDDVAQEARKSGISFDVTAAAAKEIHDAGGSNDLIRVLRTLQPHAAAPPPKNPPHAAAATSSPPVLMIESNPGQSQVYVDDEPMGSTSQQGRLRMTRLAAGEHRVRVALPGYEDHEETVTLAAGQTATVAATLQRPAETPAPQVYTPPAAPQPEQNPTVSPGQSGFLGVQAKNQQAAGARGVVVTGVTPGTPAEQAGLKANDAIVAVNGRNVSNVQELKSNLAGHQVGEVVQITWYNGSAYVTRPIRLAAPVAAGQVPVQQPESPPTLTNMPHNGMASFYVGHDHGQSGKDYCVGMMSIGNGMIIYKSNNGVHNFQFPLNTVKEARRNAVYLVALGAFHIRLNRGTNFNFVALNQQNQWQPPDPILTAVSNAMGR